MTVIALNNELQATTSSAGSKFLVALGAAPTVLRIATAILDQATGNTYVQGLIAPCAERTTTGPIGRIELASTKPTSEAVLEIRMRSGLTWDELGVLFEVTRRSVHNWANGKATSAGHDRMIRRMLAAIRHIDRGNRRRTRDLLLSVDEGNGDSIFDLLRSGRFYEAVGRVGGAPVAERQGVFLSQAAWEARRPPPPILLLEAEQDRPDFPAKARAVRPKRIPKKAE